MSAWSEIKKFFTADATPGSFGYLRNVRKAALLYGQLIPYLADKNHDEFNADTDATEALLSSRVIEDVEGCF